MWLLIAFFAVPIVVGAINGLISDDDYDYTSSSPSTSSQDEYVASQDFFLSDNDLDEIIFLAIAEEEDNA